MLFVWQFIYSRSNTFQFSDWKLIGLQDYLWLLSNEARNSCNLFSLLSFLLSRSIATSFNRSGSSYISSNCGGRYYSSSSRFFDGSLGDSCNRSNSSRSTGSRRSRGSRSWNGSSTAVGSKIGQFTVQNIHSVHQIEQFDANQIDLAAASFLEHEGEADVGCINIGGFILEANSCSEIIKCEWMNEWMNRS